MPRNNTGFGEKDRKNLMSLVEVLISLAAKKPETEDAEDSKVKAYWREDSPRGERWLKVTGEQKLKNKNQLIEATTLLDLVKLIEKFGKSIETSEEKGKRHPKNPSADKYKMYKIEQVRYAIQNLKTLKLLDDERELERLNKNKPYWVFTLKLKSEDIAENMQWIENNWEKVRGDKLSQKTISPNSQSQQKSLLAQSGSKKESHNILVNQNIITHKKQIEIIKVFISHEDNEEDNQFVQHIRSLIEEYNINFWQELIEGKRSNDQPSELRKQKIFECDFFCVVVSQQLLSNRHKLLDIYEELELAKSLDNKPKILFLIKNIDDPSDIEIRGRNGKSFKIKDWLCYSISTRLKLKEKYKLLDLLLHPITFIDNIENSSKDHERKWFTASRESYEKTFFPKEDERLPFEEITWRISEYNSNLKSEWYEVYALWHIAHDTVGVEYPQLSENILGMSYICVHLDTGYCFYNYKALIALYNNDRCREFFSMKIEKKIREVIKERRADQQLKAMIFETYPIDIKFLASIAKSDQIYFTDGQEEQKFFNQFRYLQRLVYFFKSFFTENVYAVLHNIQDQNNNTNFLGDPFPYLQPGMTDPVESRNTPFILMIALFDLEMLENEDTLIKEVITFVFDNLFLSGSDDRAINYKSNVQKMKEDMLKKSQESECRLGQLHNINTNSDQDAFTLEQLFNKLNAKIRQEDLEAQARGRKTLRSQIKF